MICSNISVKQFTEINDRYILSHRQSIFEYLYLLFLEIGTKYQLQIKCDSPYTFSFKS